MSLFDVKAKFLRDEISKAQYIDEMYLKHQHLYAYASYIGETDIAKIEITENKVIMESRSSKVKILCDLGNKRIAPLEILNFGHYEQTDSDMIFRLVKPGFHVFDIGANIGWYALNIAKIHDTSHVWAFEPVSATFAALEANLELNQLPNISAYNFGFADRPGDVIFYIPPGGSENASAENLSERADAQTVLCRLITLDDFVTANDLRVDFIKCDVEGAELLVFKGGLQVLKKFQPVIFTEMLRKWSAKFHYHPNEIIALLAELDYRCFVAKAGRLVEFFSMDDSTKETNFFFLHSSHHAAEIA